MRGKAIKDWKKIFFNTIFIFIFPLLFYTFIIFLGGIFVFFNIDFKLINTFTPRYFFQFFLIIAYFPISFWLLHKYNNYDFVRPIIKEVFEQIPPFIIVLSLIASISLIFTGYNSSFLLSCVCIILQLLVFFIILLYPFFQIRELSLLRKLLLMVKMELIINVIAFAFSPVVVIYQAVFEHEETDIVTSLIFLAIIVLLLIINFFLWYAIRRLERIKYSIKASIVILLKEIIYIIKRMYYFIGVFIIPVGVIYLLYFLINDVFPSFLHDGLASVWIITNINLLYHFLIHFGEGMIMIFVLYIFIYIDSRYNVFTYYNAEINNFKVFLREDPVHLKKSEESNRQ